MASSSSSSSSSTSSLKEKHEQQLALLFTKHDWRKVAACCEEYELYVSSQTTDIPDYAVHLASYLLCFDLINARYLWKRIPSSVKSTNIELNGLWKIGRALWLKSYADVYSAIREFSWPEPLKSLVLLLEDSFRKQMFVFISKSYTSILLSDACLYLGLPSDQTVLLATEHGWTYDSTAQMLNPKAMEESKEYSTSLIHLQQLTDYFCALENH